MPFIGVARAADVVAANDSFSTATVVEALPFASEVAPVATSETGEPHACFSEAGVKTTWFRFAPAEDVDVNVSTRLPLGGENYGLAIFTGTILESLTPVRCLDGFGSPIGFSARGGITYYIQVSRHIEDVVPFGLDVTPTSSISGRLTNREDIPLRDICAQAIATEGYDYFTAYSGVDGRYSIRFITPGTYRLVFFDCSTSPRYEHQWYSEKFYEEDADILTLATSNIASMDAALDLLPRPPPSLEKSDWVVVRLTASDQTTARGWLSIGTRLDPSGTGPMFLGIGYGDSEAGGTVETYAWGGGASRITLTNQGADLDVSPAAAYGYGGVSGGIEVPELPPGRSVAILVFSAGMTMPAFSYNTSFPRTSAAPVVEVTDGFGSTALLAADPDDGGEAAGVGPIAAGTSTHSRALSTGIAGAVPQDFCNACVGTWSPPDGSAHDWVGDGFKAGAGATGAGGETTFAGPAGTWTWTWTGAGGANTDLLSLPRPSPAYAAYAPIGYNWSLFAAHA